MRNRAICPTGVLVCGLVLSPAAMATEVPRGDMVAQLMAIQGNFIRDINAKRYDAVLAAYDTTYRGLITEKGVLTLAARRQMFRDQFVAADPGTISILETQVRPLGERYALLESHLRNDFATGKPAEEWWYSAIYVNVAGGWKVIHEQ